MWPPGVCLEPRHLAVISRVAGSFPDPCGVVYVDKFFLDVVVVVVVVGTYVGRLPVKIIFALFGSRVRCWCVLH